MIHTQIEGSTKKMLQHVKDLVGIQLDEVKLSFPIDSAQQVSEWLWCNVFHNPYSVRYLRCLLLA